MIKQLFRVAIVLLLALGSFLMPNRPPIAQSAVQPEQGFWRRWLFRAAVLMAVFGLGGFFVAVSGIISIKASSGHWAITRWFLNFAKERSVATHSLKIKPPHSLDNPWMAMKGAGHYEIGCRPCHGSPDLPQPEIARHLMPPPPNLTPEIADWDSQELFYIVKHGIKFTGMPAWPDLRRDDEVWSMVAFLQRLPKLDAKEYRELSSGGILPDQGDAMKDLLASHKVPRSIIESCARCHGWDGLGRGSGAFPKLAGQRPGYLFASMDAYARGNRHSGIMEPLAVGLSSETMRELARFYANLPDQALTASNTMSLESVERGRIIANEGVPNQGIPACVACHGPSNSPKNPNYPTLAGQYSDYIVLQLELFKSEKRGGSAYAHIMSHVARHLNPEQMRDVASYFSSLGPQSKEGDNRNLR